MKIPKFKKQNINIAFCIVALGLVVFEIVQLIDALKIHDNFKIFMRVILLLFWIAFLIKYLVAVMQNREQM